MRYAVYVLPQALRETKEAPGNMRRRIRREIDGLCDDPTPAHSRRLHADAKGVALYRIRLDRWRLVFAVDDAALQVHVLAVRKRPPYTYSDLNDLLRQIQQ